VALERDFTPNIITNMKKPYIIEAEKLGWLEGVTLSDQLHYFGGLPYALPGDRFSRARPLPIHYRYAGRFTSTAAPCPQPLRSDGPDPSEWDENCLQLNIYIPLGEAPPSGWPVFFYIHGGFLQWGSPIRSPKHLLPLMGESAFRAIIVAPAYRLNVFGFIASRELQIEAQTYGESTGNQGFWDQRIALEWTAKNIDAFGGDANNITIGGYSAGSHSVFHQLAHELYFIPDDKAIIKRAIMWSNGAGVQPKSLEEQQKQFDELLTGLKIDSALSDVEKLKQLRDKSAAEIVHVNNQMSLSEFRATSDGDFISKHIITHINSGDFGRRMKARGIKLMNGECRDEHHLYGSWRTPSPSFDAVYKRLCADYPETVVKKLMEYICGMNQKLPEGCRDWPEAFGKLYANMQVHCLERGFHQALIKGGMVPGQDLLRYRFDWRTSGTQTSIPIEWGVTHTTDMAIWFWGFNYGGLTKEEEQILKPFNEAFAAFVRGSNPVWGTNHVQEMLRLREDGEIDVWIDDRWDEGIQVWELINGGEMKSRL
jgi:carboxylesterase type B